jgi:hypothetical protein
MSTSLHGNHIKQLTVEASRELRLDPAEELRPDDAIFFAPCSAAGGLSGGGQGSALLSVGIVFAAGRDEIVVHELLRPNPMAWAPSAWCSNPNTLFPTGVRVVVPRSAVRARAKIARRDEAGAGGVFGGAADGGETSTRLPPEGLPFELSGDNAPVPIAGASAFLWSTVDSLRLQSAQASGDVSRLSRRIDDSSKYMRQAIASADEAAEQRIARAIAWTDQRFGERDAFVMRELSAITDVVKKKGDGRAAADAAAERARAEMAERLESVERNVAALQLAQARINEKTAAQLHDSAARAASQEATLEAMRAETAECTERIVELSELVTRRLGQLARQLAEAQEEIDALRIGVERGAGSAKRHAPGGQLVPRVPAQQQRPRLAGPHGSAAGAQHLPARDMSRMTDESIHVPGGSGRAPPTPTPMGRRDMSTPTTQ